MTSLYELSVPPFLAGFTNATNVLKKGEAWAKANGKSDEEIMKTTLHPDMLGFSFQIYVMVAMPVKLIADVTKTEAPAWVNDKDGLKTWADLYKRIDQAVEYLKAVKPEQLDGNENGVSTSSYGPGLTWQAQTQRFALRHTIPNFYFHFTTAYDILRSLGVEVGKGDYIGDALTKVD